MYYQQDTYNQSTPHGHGGIIPVEASYPSPSSARGYPYPSPSVPPPGHLPPPSSFIPKPPAHQGYHAQTRQDPYQYRSHSLPETIPEHNPYIHTHPQHDPPYSSHPNPLHPIQINPLPGSQAARESPTSLSPSSTAQGDRFPCDKCDRSFTRAHDRKRHYETHHLSNPAVHRCRHCDKSFSRSDSLRRHMNNNGCPDTQ